ncbi:MAG: TVP38/TMEM64 family protein [Cyanobacteria bacterium J06639_1]
MKLSNKQLASAIALVCLVSTIAVAYALGGLDPDFLRDRVRQAGIWAPVIYILVYAVATLLILPSTALNLAGGALFGPWWGTLWTSGAAILAAAIAFGIARTIGREAISRRLAGRWQALDAEIAGGGTFYMFAIRLMPVIPYGLVNFAAGLTAISWRSYAVGTCLGTVPGILPFVFLGSTGLQAMQTGELLPVLGAIAAIGVLVLGATVYRRRRRPICVPSSPSHHDPNL